ncbi:MAG: TIM44-like domain-containing protein [Planctomycetota bacterium]|nr:TIM44-like domain-containing protein [Planctomycetota bacterium]
MLNDLILTLAQAGGGGSFGSGGGGGGGGFGGSDGGGDLGGLVYLLIHLILRVPIVGIPLAILIVVLMIRGATKGEQARKGRIIRKGREQREAARPVPTTALQAVDPAFDEQHFLTRVAAAFHIAQDSWCAQQLAPLRPFVSDGVFERFGLQVAEQRASGWRQGMQDVQLGKPEVLACEVAGPFEALTVRLPFRATISKLDLASGRELPGSRLPETDFAECWTLLRRRGAKSLTTGGLIEGQCPNCGARLELSRSARCGTCSAEVLSGQFDWVLVEITQASVWQPRRQAVAGLASYRERDQDFDLALVEDQVSVAFWRLRQAEQARAMGLVLCVGTEAWCAELESSWQAADRSGKTYVKLDVAVGSVDTRGILVGDDRDRVLVEVVWDGINAEPGTPPAKLAGHRRSLARDLFILGRRAGRTTRWKEGLTTAHCASCGGADTGEASDVCPWCDEPRRGGPDRWLVEEVVALGTSRAKELLAGLAKPDARGASASAAGPALAAPPVPRQLLLWAASLAGADGELDPGERDALVAIGRRTGLSEAELNALTPRDLGLDEWEAAEPPAGPVDTDEARLWLTELVTLALADGKVSKSEERWLAMAASRLGFVRADLNHAINKQRAALYQATRAKKR